MTLPVPPATIRPMRAPVLLCTLVLLAALGACGTLPQPFYGNPGATGARLAQPPTSRLVVPTPSESLLADAAARGWATATAEALVQQEVPALTARKPTRSDWSLVLAAEIRGGTVIPSYTVHNPAGESQGISEGAPVPTAEWAAGTPQVLKAAAEQAAPGIASMLSRIEAARRQSDPNSLLNRPTRVYLTPLEGAPGDGDRSIPREMRAKLEANGLVVQDAVKNADFQVRGQMVLAKGANGTVRIELQWIVEDARGERGRILQINEVDPRSVSPFWGDTAVAVATEAAGGVKDVIANAGGAHGGPASPATARAPE